MDQLSNENLKTDLLYKSFNYKWKYTKNNVEETPMNIIHDILFQDIGTKLKGSIVLNFDNLKSPLMKMIEKKITIENQIKKLVKVRKKKYESGASLGSAIFPILQNLIPLDLVGGPHNRFFILKAFRRALKSGLRDSIRLISFVNGLKTKKVNWLNNVQYQKSKVLIMAKLVKWLWRVTKSLIASNYYVTETQVSSQLIYIPQKIWQSKTDKQLNFMINQGILKPLSENETSTFETMRRPAHLRWLPKISGLRPIIFLRKSEDKIKNQLYKTENDQLKAFLRYLIKSNNHTIRSTPKEIHQAWRNIVTNLDVSKQREVHLVSVDINDAYGCIIQEKLMGIVRRSSSICFGTGKQDNFLEFKQTTLNKKMVLICKGLAVYPMKSASTQLVKITDLLESLDKVVKCQTIKREKKSFLLKKGISQAIPVSAALCELYLTFFVKTHLAEFHANGDAFIRNMDDFLFVSPNRDRCQQFMTKMNEGFPDFNLKINKEKTQTTLDGLRNINYFGFTFASDLEIYVKTNVGADLPFRHILTFNHRLSPLQTLEDKLLRIPIHKLTSLTLDPAYISVKGVSWNVFQTACQMACCFKAIVDTLGSASFSKEALLKCIIQHSTSVACKTFRIRKKNDIYIRELFWIVVRAFFLCLSRYCNQNSIFPGLLFPHLEHIEDEARSKVRQGIIKSVVSFIEFLPSNFKTGY